MDVSERFWTKVNKSGTVPLGCGLTDTCWLWTASVNANGYGRIKSDGLHLIAHKYAYRSLVGEVPTGMVLDHICRVRTCVNPAHLRLATVSENNCNRSSQNKTGYRGVYWKHRDNNFEARIQFNKRPFHLGRFKTAELAYAAYCEAAVRLHGAFANLGLSLVS